MKTRMNTPAETSEDLVAAIMAVLLLTDHGGEQHLEPVRVREVWPSPTEWRWIGW